ncbi:MAG: hypothetical protein R3C56_19990 [Pirellulaceae bacterium]
MAAVVVRMVDKDQRSVSQFEVMKMARELMARYSHLRISADSVARLGGGGMRSAPVQYNLRGDNLTEMNAVADKIVKKLEATLGFVDVNTTSVSGKPELSITIDRGSRGRLECRSRRFG